MTYEQFTQIGPRLDALEKEIADLMRQLRERPIEAALLDQCPQILVMDGTTFEITKSVVKEFANLNLNFIKEISKYNDSQSINPELLKELRENVKELADWVKQGY